MEVGLLWRIGRVDDRGVLCLVVDYEVGVVVATTLPCEFHKRHVVFRGLPRSTYTLESIGYAWRGWLRSDTGNQPPRLEMSVGTVYFSDGGLQQS